MHIRTNRFWLAPSIYSLRYGIDNHLCVSLFDDVKTEVCVRASARSHIHTRCEFRFGKLARMWCDRNTHHASWKLACISCSLQFLSIFVAKHTYKAFILHCARSLALFAVDNLFLWYSMANSAAAQFTIQCLPASHTHTHTHPYMWAHIFWGLAWDGYHGNVNDKRNDNNKSQKWLSQYKHFDLMKRSLCSKLYTNIYSSFPTSRWILSRIPWTSHLYTVFFFCLKNVLY